MVFKPRNGLCLGGLQWAHVKPKQGRGSDRVARPQFIPRLLVFLPPVDKSEPYEGACQAVRDDPDFGPVVGALIGDASTQTRFDEATVINGAVQSTLTDKQQSKIDEGVRQAIARLRQYVTAAERHSAVLIPLPGLKCSQFPFDLEEGLQIDELKDDEIDACAKTGVLQPFPGRFPGMNMFTAEECVGVRIRLTSPAAITLPGAKPSNLDPNDKLLNSTHRFGDRSPGRVAELVEDVLFVLRLARPDFVSTRGSVHVSDTVMGNSYMSGTRAIRHSFNTNYIIDGETGQRLRELWATLRRSSRDPSLPTICSRRFNAAMDRASVEDTIVDHLIAAEALFLRDAGRPEDRGELGFRLAMRMAALLEANGRHRRTTFKFVKRAYELRSEIAHGGSAPPEVKVRERGNVPLQQFVNELGELMREALVQAVQEYASRSNFATSAFWDDLLLGAQASTASS